MSNSNIFSYIIGAQIIAFDMYPDLTKEYKDNLFYTFKAGEEIETVLFYYVKNSPDNFKNVYMSAAFLSGSGSPTSVSSGNYMLPLNIIDGKVTK